MTLLLPIVALVLGLLALLVEVLPAKAALDPAPPPPTVPESPKVAWGALGALLVLALIAGLMLTGALREGAFGVAVGLLTALLCDCIGRHLAVRGATPSLAPLGLTLIVIACATLLPFADPAGFPLGAIIGAGFGAGILALGAGVTAQIGGLQLTLLLTAFGALSILGEYRDTPRLSEAALVLGSLALLAALLGHVVSSFSPQSGTLLRGGIGGVILAAGGVLLAQQYLELPAAGWLWLAGLGTALVVGWLLTSTTTSAGAGMLAGLLWIGSATVAFGWLQGFGIALWAVAASVLLTLMQHPRALASAGVIALLALERVLLETLTGTAPELNLSRHYVLIGLLIGLGLPLALAELDRALTGRGFAVLGGILAALAGAATLLLTPILFTLQAAIGCAAGLSVAPILGVLQGTTTRQVPLAAMALAALLILALPSLEPLIGLSRADKLQALIYGSVVIAVVVLVVGLVVRQPIPAATALAAEEA